MIIRQERPSDYAEVYDLIRMAFVTATHGDGTEADYLLEVRNKDEFIPELSLVAEHENGKIIGQIVLYQTTVVTPDKTITELVLSPISVHPAFFRRGIARALMERGFALAKNMGYSAVFLCGDPEFYHKIGFAPTYKYGIYHIADKNRNAEWCMARELITGSLADVYGTIDIR